MSSYIVISSNPVRKRITSTCIICVDSLNNEMTFCSTLFSDNVQSLLFEEVPVRVKRRHQLKKKKDVSVELWELMHLGRTDSQLQLVSPSANEIKRERETCQTFTETL